MKTVVSLLGVLLVVGCATPTQVVSNNTNLLQVGDTKPAGYPRTFIQKESGYCLQVSEDWRKSDYQGKTIWLKDSQHKTVTCPA